MENTIRLICQGCGESAPLLTDSMSVDHNKFTLHSIDVNFKCWKCGKVSDRRIFNRFADAYNKARVEKIGNLQVTISSDDDQLGHAPPEFKQKMIKWIEDARKNGTEDELEQKLRLWHKGCYPHSKLKPDSILNIIL